MKGAERIYWRSGRSKQAKERLSHNIEKLTLYCRAPRARAKRATYFDLHEETKQYTTHWPSHELLKSIEDDVRTSLMKSAGVNASVVMDIIGHESEAISAHYTHIDEETKRAALNSLPVVKIKPGEIPPKTQSGLKSREF
jgi:hypothetical protein